MEPDGPLAVVQLLLHRGGELSVPKDHLSPRLQFPPWPDQALPQVAPPVHQEKHLAGPAGGAAADQPGGQHPAVVENQAVSGAQKPHQVIKMVVAHSACALVQGEQTGGIPPLQRGLGDQLLRELKIEIRSFQSLHPF